MREKTVEIEDICDKICNHLYLKYNMFIEVFKHGRNTVAFDIFSYKKGKTIKDIFKQEYGKDITIIDKYVVYFTYDELLEFYTILKMKGDIS